ncbi:MAG: hypothetical protein LBK58_15450 [Prevotellaceae bacterium]|nr:hypothetical protein [Prevotellaceae bacterium]
MISASNRNRKSKGEAPTDLCKLSKLLNLNILMIHYPPYCSKYNPIEHQCFSQLTRAWQGVPFYNIHRAGAFAEPETRCVTSLPTIFFYQITEKSPKKFGGKFFFVSLRPERNIMNDFNTA